MSCCWLPFAFPLAVAAALFAAYQSYSTQRPFKAIKPGSTAVVTGGGSGIGKEIAIALSKRKCNVVVVGRNETNLKAAVEACKAAGAPSAEYVILDLCDKTRRLDAVEWKLGGKAVDYLVLNAGQGAIMPFDDSEASYTANEDLVNLNFLANVRLIQHFRAPIEAQKGSILVISSLAGVLPSAHRAAYTASKHAMQGFCNAFRQELSDSGASLTVVCPGFVATEFHDRVLTNSSGGGHGSSSSGRKCATPQSVARDALEAMERGKLELIMTTAGWAGYLLRPFFPQLVDAMAKKKALASIQAESKHK